MNLFDRFRRNSQPRAARRAAWKRETISWLFAGEMLEDRCMLAGVDLTVQEQLLLELVNRARANPTAEAARYGIALNDDLEPGEISTDAKQPLSPNQALTDAARGHSDDMLSREFFDHVNPDGQDPSARAREAGYGAGAGENIAWYGTPTVLERNAEVYRRHEALFLSPPHRTNMMSRGYRELGLGVRYGEFERLQAIMVTENFGNRGGDFFITGVAYSDVVTEDNFYTIGEGLRQTTITATRNNDGETFTATTGDAGGYGLQVPAGVYTVTATGSRIPDTLSVSNVVIRGSNVKVDFNTREMNLGSIAGVAFEDADGDGVRDVGEPVLPNQVIYLDADEDGRMSPMETQVTTSATGAFRFDDLLSGTYTMRQELRPGWEATRPASESFTVALNPNQDRSGFLFGAHQFNAAPFAGDDTAITDSGLGVNMDVFANDGDEDGTIDLESTLILEPPGHGNVVLNTVTQQLVYTADSDYVGVDSFQYAVVDDGGLESNAATVSIQVNPDVGLRWHNPAESLDVNNDTYVSSIDALIILNTINLDGSRRLRFPTAQTASPPPYLDVNGDKFVTPIDALFVLNEINRIAAERKRTVAAEGESRSPTSLDPLPPTLDLDPAAMSGQSMKDYAAAVDQWFDGYGEDDQRNSRRSTL